MSASFRYSVGGSLQVNAPDYVERQADIVLYDALLNGEFCYIFSCRQMGKSSLLVRVKAKLEAVGAQCAYLDMTRLGSDELTVQQWYGGMVASLLQNLNLWNTIHFQEWWRSQQELPLLHRLNQLVETILLPASETAPLYIFIDEIDSLLSLDFSTDDFFAWMRSCYNRRAVDCRYRRLTFALFGVTTPTDLIADKRRTPFNIGRAIPLSGFTLEESMPLLLGLQPWMEHSQLVLKGILTWTDGQPFLTQKLCSIAVQAAQHSETVPLPLSPEMVEVCVENLVRSHVIDYWETQDEPVHLRTIRDHLFEHQNRAGRILGIYQDLLDDNPVYVDNSREQVDLLLSGLVVRRGDQLFIKNRIYRHVFTQQWVNRQLDQLRPYAPALDAWIANDFQDNSRLLRGQALDDALQWARGKSLNPVDHQFLSASENLNRQEIQTRLEAEQLRAAKKIVQTQRERVILPPKEIGQGSH